MGREDAILALRRHATSKIRDAADLTAIRTLGFRGEALAAIASVARMLLRTRRPGDEHGVEIAAAGGEIERVGACAMAPGTRIEVRELFFNTPARLKFLKTVATEQGAAAAALQRLALANYRVAFGLNADGRNLIALPRAAAPLERLRQLFGAKLAERMLAFDYRGGARAWGLAATSQESFATPRMVFTFVNGRAVRDRAAGPRDRAGLPDAASARTPSGGRAVRRTARRESRRQRPSDEDRGPLSPCGRAVRAGLSCAARAARRPDRPRRNQTAGGNSQTADRQRRGPDHQGRRQARQIVRISAQIAERGERPLRLVADAPAARIEQRALGLGYGGAGNGGSTGAGNGIAAAYGPGAPELAPPPAADTAAHAETGQHTVTGPHGAPVPRYSELRVLGQLFAGYIALEDDDGLVLVDQHAAHERVTFERLSAQLRAGGVRSQALLAPATLELGPARAAQVTAGLAELGAIGFELEPFGPSTLLLKGVPAVFGAEGGVALLTDLIDGLGEGGLRTRGAGAFEDLLKRLACHGSVRVGRVLAPGEISALLAELDATAFKSNCPHGRPVHIRFARSQIERLFRR